MVSSAVAAPWVMDSMNLRLPTEAISRETTRRRAEGLAPGLEATSFVDPAEALSVLSMRNAVTNAIPKATNIHGCVVCNRVTASGRGRMMKFKATLRTHVIAAAQTPTMK